MATVEQAARTLNLSRRSVLRRLKTGELAGKQVDGCWVIDEESIQEFERGMVGDDLGDSPESIASELRDAADAVSRLVAQVTEIVGAMAKPLPLYLGALEKLLDQQTTANLELQGRVMSTLQAHAEAVDKASRRQFEIEQFKAESEMAQRSQARQDEHRAELFKWGKEQIPQLFAYGQVSEALKDLAPLLEKFADPEVISEAVKAGDVTPAQAAALALLMDNVRKAQAKTETKEAEKKEGENAE